MPCAISVRGPVFSTNVLAFKLKITIILLSKSLLLEGSLNQRGMINILGT